MRTLRLLGAIAFGLLLGGTAGRAASLTVPAGATISVRMVDALDSRTNYVGETFRGTLDAPLLVEGRVLVPRGAEAIGRLVAVQQSGRLRGRSLVAVELTALNFAGRSITIQTSAFQEAGSSRGRDTAKWAGGGGLAGTIFGAIFGGRTGALVGATVGAAGGTVVQTIRGAKSVSIPAESLVVFTLQSPIAVDPNL